jgi:hypothetical protein
MRWTEIAEDTVPPNPKPPEQPLATDPEAKEKERLVGLAKARGLDTRPPKVTPEQIIQAAQAPPAARLRITDATTDEELSDFIRGRRRGQFR